jgi:N-acetylglucosamine-6-phosphate deacetylase
MRIRGRHYATGQVVDVECAASGIASVAAAGSQRPDVEAGWVAPALFDLQVNGCEGRNFASAHLAAEDVLHVVRVCRRHGVAGLLPTLITASFEALRHGFATLRQARERFAEVARAVPGYHLEGPYISAEDGPRGAHPRQHVRRPNRDEFLRLQEAAEGRIRLVTLAPEHEGAPAFIEWLVGQGVVVALGHTAASAEQIRAAIRAGARLSTHLGNGSHALLPRHDNYVWTQLAADELWASIIADGHHLPPALLKVMARVKTSARLILTCDASSLAGLPPGRYAEWGQELEVLPEGKVVVPGTPYLAGSAAFTDTCVAVALREMGLPLAEVLDMAGARPREPLGLPAVRLEAGSPADLVLFEHGPEEGFRVRGTVVAEEWFAA